MLNAFDKTIAGRFAIRKSFRCRRPPLALESRANFGREGRADLSAMPAARDFIVRLPPSLSVVSTTGLNKRLSSGTFHVDRSGSLQRRDSMMLSFVHALRPAGTAATGRDLSRGAACLLGLFYCSSALADQWYTGATNVVPPNEWIVAIDASATATSNQTPFGYAAATIAVGGGTLQQSGFRLKLEGLAGTYGYQQADIDASERGKQYEGGALAGYQAVWNNATLAAYLGVDVRENTIPATDPVNTALGTRVGFKAAIDAYLRPTDQTMLSTYASYSTAYDAYYARFRAGYSVFGLGYLGPELTFLGDDYYGQTRLGAHFSGVQVGALQVGVAGGYVWDRGYKDGYFGTLELRAGF
jgi:hypothetical protein